MKTLITTTAVALLLAGCAEQSVGPYLRQAGMLRKELKLYGGPLGGVKKPPKGWIKERER